jgi:hypothetical protein
MGGMDGGGMDGGGMGGGALKLGACTEIGMGCKELKMKKRK